MKVKPNLEIMTIQGLKWSITYLCPFNFNNLWLLWLGVQNLCMKKIGSWQSCWWLLLTNNGDKIKTFLFLLISLINHNVGMMLAYEKISKENRILAVLCIVLASIFFCVVLGLQFTIFETNTHRVFVSRLPLTTTTTPEPGKMSQYAARGYDPKNSIT